jgi:hypothetical protein
MTPPAAASARTRTRTTTRTPPQRRVSGPARGRSGGAAAIAAPPPLALRLGGAVHGIAEHRYLDRIIGGRAWIAILAAGLIGIVFMQVSMLRMNAGIGASVEKASTLERQNGAMRAMISELSSGERIAAEAAKLGLVLPPGTPRFLDARGADAAKAAAAITLPGEGIVPSPQSAAALETQTLATATATPTLGQTGVVPEADTTAPTTAETETAAVPTYPTEPDTVPTTTATTATDPSTTTTTDSTATTQTTTPVTPTPTATDTGGANAPTG